MLPQNGVFFWYRTLHTSALLCIKARCPSCTITTVLGTIKNRAGFTVSSNGCREIKSDMSECCPKMECFFGTGRYILLLSYVSKLDVLHAQLRLYSGLSKTVLVSLFHLMAVEKSSPTCLNVAPKWSVFLVPDVTYFCSPMYQSSMSFMHNYDCTRDYQKPCWFHCFI